MAAILQGLNPDSYDRVYTDRQLLKRIRPLFGSRAPLVALIAGCALIAAVAGAALPVLLAHVIDTADTDAVDDGIAPLIYGIIGVGTAAWAFTWLQQRFSAGLVGGVVLEMRTKAFDAVMRQEMAFFDAQSSGAIASRITTDTQAFSTLAVLTLDLLSQSLMILIVMAALFVISPMLGTITALVAVVIIAVSLGFRRISRGASRQQQRATAKVNGYVQETLRGIAVARNFRGEEAAGAGLEEVNGRWYRASVRTNRIFSGIFPLLLTLTGLGTVAVVQFGGHQVADGHVSGGEWVLFMEALMLFWFPLTSIASFWSQFQQGLAAGERIFSLVDRETQVRQSAQEPVESIDGRIEFREVTFGYGSGEPVLRDFDLSVGAGETVALVGHTGAGKSSIIRLISRAYEYQSGSVLVDGRDVRTLDLDDYRRHLGVVSQTPFLFSGTVGENIAHGRPGASQEDILAAARSVADGDWVDLLPEGLDTPTTEGGRNLSMGQRQLVALARIVLQDPEIFVLDEATASIDPLTESLIQEGLDVLSSKRTSVIVAHRLPTVRKADRIVVIDAGRVLEQGTHDALLAAGGAYAELYDHYFRHQQLDFDEQIAEGVAARAR